MSETHTYKHWGYCEWSVKIIISSACLLGLCPSRAIGSRTNWWHFIGEQASERQATGRHETNEKRNVKSPHDSATAPATVAEAAAASRQNCTRIMIHTYTRSFNDRTKHMIKIGGTRKKKREKNSRTPTQTQSKCVYHSRKVLAFARFARAHVGWRTLLCFVRVSICPQNIIKFLKICNRLA